MGLFDKKTDEEESIKKKIDEAIKDAVNERRDATAFIQYMSYISDYPERSTIQPVDLLLDLVDILRNNRRSYNLDNITPAIKEAEKVYNQIFVYGDKTPDFTVLRHVFLSLYEPDGIIIKKVFNYSLLSAFKNKINYLEFMRSIMNNQKINEILYDLVTYANAVRSYFIDDEAFLANMKNIATRLYKKGDKALILEEEIKKVEHMAGIYEVDVLSIAKVEEQLIEAKTILKQSLEILAQIDQKNEQMTRIMDDTSKAIMDISKRETDLLTSKANTAKEDINTAYNGFLEEQRQEVVLQKDIFLEQVFRESENKLNEIRQMARLITSSANSELSKINAETSNAIERISNLKNDEQLEKLFLKADENEELLSKIRKLEILNDNNIATISQNIESAGTITSAKSANNVQAVSSPAVNAGTVSSVDIGMPVISHIQNNDDNSVQEGINPLLDESISFELRYQKIMEEKNKRIAAGEHFHCMFDDVMIALLENNNPYLIGPSGCGKTYMVKQISSMLNMDYIDIGYINEEYDILGFMTATGGYSSPNFYRCYKHGMIAFCDELDNGNSRATVKLNSFLSNSVDASYNFPNGENVKRHPSFRIIAAGNTAGNGADANYNTREKIEESVQQRFTPIYVDYDNSVEEKILGQYVDWYQFIVAFRCATDEWANMNDCSAPGIITTRDAQKIKKYLDNKSFSPKKIIEYEFVQTKDMEYLAFIDNYINKNKQNYPKATALIETFSQRVYELRERGGRR